MHGSDKIIPFDIRKKIIASTTSEGWREAPHVSYIYEADVTDFYKEFRIMNSSEHQEHISFNTLLLKVIVEGIKAAPQMNSEIHFNPFLAAGRITVKKEININMPILLPDGEMITINLRNLGNKSLLSIGKQIKFIIHKIYNSDIERSLIQVGVKDTLKILLHRKPVKAFGRGFGAVIGKKKFKPFPSKANIINAALLDQGTITVSNLGAAIRGTKGKIGILDIIPPQVCVIGIGVLQDCPGIIRKGDGREEIGIRKILPITIVFDHRALDFGDVAPFITRLDKIFYNPKIIHRW